MVKKVKLSIVPVGTKVWIVRGSKLDQGTVVKQVVKERSCWENGARYFYPYYVTSLKYVPHYGLIPRLHSDECEVLIEEETPDPSSESLPKVAA